MQSSIPHYKVSYAQNFEDLVLAGLLKDVVNGSYVDVGANHDLLDSVTKLFYDMGWRGINIEPNAFLHKELCEKRVDDLNLRIGLASVCCSSILKQFERLDGLSTFSDRRASEISLDWPDQTPTLVPIEISTLSLVLNQHCKVQDIHFLKVDVEGLELEVLLGNDWCRWRPWVICVERSQTKKYREAQKDMDTRARNLALFAFLEAVSYRSVFFDGINDFFIATEKQDLWEKFDYGRDVILNGVPINHIFVKYLT